MIQEFVDRFVNYPKLKLLGLQKPYVDPLQAKPTK